MKLIKEDLRAWDQESIDNQNALASIAKEIKKLFDESGDVNYATIDYDIFDYGNEILIKDVYDPDDIGNFIEDELGFRFRVKNTEHGYGDVYVDTTQEYEDENGDIYTRVSREYLDEKLTESEKMIQALYTIAEQEDLIKKAYNASPDKKETMIKIFADNGFDEDDINDFRYLLEDGDSKFYFSLDTLIRDMIIDAIVEVLGEEFANHNIEDAIHSKNKLVGTYYVPHIYKQGSDIDILKIYEYEDGDDIWYSYKSNSFGSEEGFESENEAYEAFQNNMDNNFMKDWGLAYDIVNSKEYANKLIDSWEKEFTDNMDESLGKETTKCALCKKEIKGYGNNGQPLTSGKVCDQCNKEVIKARLSNLTESKNIVANIYDKDENIIETRHFSSREQLDDYVNTLDNLVDMTAGKHLYKNKNGELATRDVWKIIVDTTMTENKKKKEQGYFVKYNAGSPQQNQAIFNKNMTPNISGGSSSQGLGEGMEVINIKKELNDIDWENDLALSDMYYSMDLSEEEKKEIAHLINERNIDRLKDYIENLYKKSVDLDIEENEILSELNDILAIANKGSFEVKEESDKNTVIDMLKKKGFELEVSGNNNGYHIEYWKEEI